MFSAGEIERLSEEFETKTPQEIHQVGGGCILAPDRLEFVVSNAVCAAAAHGIADPT